MRAKIYINGIPLDVREAELAQRFREFGHVLNVTIVCNPGNGSRGYGWVLMRHLRDAMGACAALNGTVWGTRTLRCELAHERGRRPVNHHASTIFIGNLPYAVTEQELSACFEQYGVVVRATIVLDRETQHPRGFAFVEMAEAVEAEVAAADLHGRDWSGRRLTVRVGRRDGRAATYSQSAEER